MFYNTVGSVFKTAIVLTLSCKYCPNGVTIYVSSKKARKWMGS